MKDIFKVSGVGITTAHDEFVIDSSKEKLLQKFIDFRDSSPNTDELHKKFNVAKKQGWDILKGWQNLQNKSNLENYIHKIAYRPFDVRYIFYEDKLVWRCVKDIMKHFLVDKNQALLVSRQESVLGDESCNPNFISDKIVDLNLYRRGGEQVMPLYVKDEANAKQNATLFEDETPKGRVENFTKEFRAFVDAKYGERFSPEQILGYIYAVLYHKDYREKYLDFLKTDFPKIPFVQSKEKFLQLSELGTELIDLHLMRERERDEKMMREVINIGLVICRQARSSLSFSHAFVTQIITEACYISNRGSEINYLIPLYLYS